MTFHSAALSIDALASEVDLLDPELPVAVAMIDLDDFDPLNKAHGHEAGDAALAEFERCLRDGLPPGGMVAHVRGDEFAAALPDCSCEEALLVLERARAAYSSGPAAPGVGQSLGVSMGIAGRPAHGATAQELFEAADAGLVRAKHSGGNRIAIHIEERMVLKSSYYPRAALHRLAKVSRRLGRPEASLLREALDEYLARHQDAVK
ncbi:MAG TPA: GGDEF domain-containing protein [Acidimicrobiales bacterium]|nr:GGDEF domain-containing protein [Acidimicrobiales bacterium]